MKLKSSSVKEAVKLIQNGRLFLPPIQRDFVWNSKKILDLFDSLYRSYPINNFIFWKLQPDTAKSYPLHQFTKSYSEKLHQKKEAAPRHMLENEVWAVVDGQQRLSSLFIGLAGVYRYKKGKGRNVESNLISSHLYFNLFETSRVSGEDEYFQFLTREESDFVNESNLWFEVGKVLSWGDVEKQVEKVLVELLDKVTKSGKKTAIKRFNERKEDHILKLHRLYKLINDDTINYLEIEEQNIDEVVEMFTRINAGGMVLKKSDLLFSTLVAMWPDAKSEIDGMVDSLKECEINVTKDFVMRTCIVLSDLPVKYRLESFNRKNIQRIRERWEGIKHSLNRMIELLPSLGYNYQKGLSENALIPIAYYIFKGGKINTDKSRRHLQLYYTVSQINGVFGGQGDAILEKVRAEINTQINETGTFNFNRLQELNLPGGKLFRLSEDELEDRVNNTGYRSPHAYFILSLLYPSIDFKVFRYQVDHLHPQSKFNRTNLKNNGINEEETIQEWLEEKKDLLPNLQLLAGVDNNNKKSKTLLGYLKDKPIQQRKDFIKQNFLPPWNNQQLMELSNFDEFFEWRAKQMVRQLKKQLRP